MDIKEFFENNNNGAVAFSGGVDSSFLVWAASKYGKGWRAYYVKTLFQPAFELEDALQVVKICGFPMEIIEKDILENKTVASNPSNRCYYCKKEIMGTILERAKEDGISLLIDGTNASDDASDRPGMKALDELKVLSPLRECGLTKADVRRLSKEAGLPTWDKPSYACLATRIPEGRTITAGDLSRIEKAEDEMFALGFKDFRVRLRDNDTALLQLTGSDIEKLIHNRQTVLDKLKGKFSNIFLDLKARR